MNPRLLGPQPSALPTELHPPYAPEGIRTPDPRLRRPLLYPAELLAPARPHVFRTSAFPPDYEFVWGGRLNGRPPAPRQVRTSCATPRHGSVPVQRGDCDVLASPSLTCRQTPDKSSPVPASTQPRSLAAQEKTCRTVGKIENGRPIHSEDNSRHTQDCQ